MTFNDLPSLFDGPSAAVLVAGAQLWLYPFLLVLIRMSGLMVAGPWLGHVAIPAQVRALLALALTLLIVPATAYGEPLPLPRTILDLLWSAAGEFLIGLSLSLGVSIVLSALQLAGDIIDQQAGLSLSEAFNPAMDSTSTVTGQTLFLLATTVLLFSEPVGAHLMMVDALVQTFRQLPVGAGLGAISAGQILSEVVHHSVVLAVQISAPVLAVMSLVSLAMGFLGHTVPQINVLVLGFAVRSTLSLFVLYFTLSGASQTMLDAVPYILEAVVERLGAG